MPPTVVRSYSKINLGLRIGPPRADGFHDLATLYQTVALHDLVTVEARVAARTEITLSASDPRVPTDHRNTAHKMVVAALAATGMQARVHVHLQKRLPPQGGMGAGSANAAATLLGLERQLGRTSPGSERLRIAASIGSDVPLFLLGGTVYGHSRGQVVLPYPDLPETACVIVSPLQGSSTPAAFRAWDAAIAGLTPQAAHDRLDELSRIYASAFTPAGNGISGSPPDAGIGTPGVSGALDGKGQNTLPKPDGDLAGNPLLALVRTGIENDFEEVVFQQHPSLREIKHALGKYTSGENGDPEKTSAHVAMLSGSGSSLFGLYGSDAEAHAAERQVQSLGTGARTYVTRTISRPTYWRTMFEQ